MFRFFTYCLCSLLIFAESKAANKTFTGPGNFSDPTKWNSGTLPVAGDNLQLNGSCTFDNAASNLAYGNLIVGFSSSSSLSWPVSGTNTLNVAAISSSVAGSSINMTNGGTLQVRTSWTTTNQTFTPGSGTVNWNVTAATSTLPAAITTYYKLTVTAGTGTVSLGTGTTVNNSMTIASGTLTMGGQNFTCSGTVFISGTLNDNAVGGNNSFQNITINSGGAIDNSANETYTVNGNFTMLGGNITGTSTATYNIAGNLFVTSGVNNMGKAKINVTGSTVISGQLNVNSTGGQKTLGNLTISPAGVLNVTVSESWTISGNITVNGTFNANLNTYTLTGTGKTISGSSAITIDDIKCNGSYTNNANVTLTNSLKGTGTWTQGTGPLNLRITDANFSVSNFDASGVGNTVNYALLGNQTVRSSLGGSYYNLTLSGSGTKTLSTATAVNGTVTISSGTTLTAANFNMTVGIDFVNNGAFIPGTSSVTMNGTAAQNISGTTSTTFHSLSITNSSAIVSASTNFSVSTTFTVGAGAIFSPSAAVIVSGAGTLTGNGTIQVTRIAATPDFLSQYTITNKVLAGLNVDYIGAGAQNVNALSYGSLTVSTNGTRTVTFPSAVVFVSNVFSPTTVTTTYVITGNTINFNGTVAQTIT